MIHPGSEVFIYLFLSAKICHLAYFKSDLFLSFLDDDLNL